MHTYTIQQGPCSLNVTITDGNAVVLPSDVTLEDGVWLVSKGDEEVGYFIVYGGTVSRMDPIAKADAQSGSLQDFLCRATFSGKAENLQIILLAIELVLQSARAEASSLKRGALFGRLHNFVRWVQDDGILSLLGRHIERTDEEYKVFGYASKEEVAADLACLQRILLEIRALVGTTPNFVERPVPLCAP